MRKIKKHIGLILILAIVIAFPTSISNQIKINMRVIVTGIAVDKEDNNFVVTAQIIKPSQSAKDSSESASIDYITDKSETLAGAISKLSFKAGKSSAFSHTNFVIIGKSLFNEDVTESLDYFVRDKIIKNSALVLFAEEKASDEIKKTKNTDHSVAIGLQKVFLFKEHESDGIMTTMMEFLNGNKSLSKTSVVSVLSLKSNDEALENASGGSQSSSSSNGQNNKNGQKSNTGAEEKSNSSTSSNSNSSGKFNESGNNSSSESKSSESSSSEDSSKSSSSGSSSEENQYFVQQSPLLMFVDGKFAGKLESDDEISGFMFTNKDSKAIDIMITSTDTGRLKDSKIEINIKNMRGYRNLSFENGIPQMNIKVKIYNAEINEVLNPDIVALLDEHEYEQMKQDLKTEIKRQVETCFKKAKTCGADIFEAYEKAYRFHYDKFKTFTSREEFLNTLKLNVDVEIRKLDY